MPFTNSPVPLITLAANKVADRINKLAHRDPNKHLESWDPTWCNAFQQAAISNAFFSLHNADIDEIRRHGYDWQALADLMKRQTVDSLNITCECRSGPPTWSNTSTKSLNICLDPTDRWLHSVWLTVEVIHLCGGTDLDAWAIKNWLFNVDKASYPYSYRSLLASEKALMCAGGTPVPNFSGYRAGKFTVWDPVGGNLYPSKKDAQGRILPAGPSLIDAGGPRTLWQYACP
jgi:hypothetical protein